MGRVKVKFLGEEYTIPTSVREYLIYDELMLPILNEMIERISSDMEEICELEFGDAYDKMEEDVRIFREIMEDGAEILIQKLFELEVYDVTQSELLDNVDAYNDIESFIHYIASILCEEGKKILALRDQGMEDAYDYASKEITGSGVRIFTNSISSLIIHSAIEKQIIMSQARRADQMYQRSVNRIRDTANSALEEMCEDVMLEKYYPGLMELLMTYPNQITSRFLAKLIENGKFDFGSIENYNMAKAEEMLENISWVSDKKQFLQKTFQVCPFSAELYEKCLELKLLDQGTFDTAEYLLMGEDLSQKIEQYIMEHQEDEDYAKCLISILAGYRNQEESAIIRMLYADEIQNVCRVYKEARNALESQKNLDSFIRTYIAEKTSDVMEMTPKEIFHAVRKTLLSMMSEGIYKELLRSKMLSQEEIRLKGSSADSLEDISNEVCKAITDQTEEFIKEAKRRWNLYMEAVSTNDEKLRDKELELFKLNSELDNLWFFAFSKKKELREKIQQKTREVESLQNGEEIERLLESFNVMYGEKDSMYE